MKRESRFLPLYSLVIEGRNKTVFRGFFALDKRVSNAERFGIGEHALVFLRCNFAVKRGGQIGEERRILAHDAYRRTGRKVLKINWVGVYDTIRIIEVMYIRLMDWVLLHN